MVSVGSVSVDVVPDARGFDRDLAAQLNPQAKAAGEAYGRDFTEGLRAQLAGSNSPDISLGVDTGKADAEVDRFIAETDAKLAVASNDTGQRNGDRLAQGMRNGFLGGSPLIAAAVAGGLAAGAPAVAAGAVAMFAGVAAVLDSSDTQFKAFASDWGGQMKAVFQDAASVTIPAFESAIQRVGTMIQDLAPNFHALFASLNEPIGLLTTGLMGMVQNLLPGLIKMMQNAGPVFQGISVMLSDIGFGLGKMFDLISQHGAAGGQVFASLGAIMQQLLPIVGQLVSVGAELAAQVLPGVASALGLVANVLDKIAPVLPGIVVGFLAFKAISALDGPLASLSARLQTAAADGEGLSAKLSGGAASAVSSLSGALPVLGVAVGALAMGFEQAQQQVNKWAQAMLDGGDAAAKAATQIQQAKDFSYEFGSGLPGIIGNLTGYSGALNTAASASDQVKQKQQELYAAMSPLQQKQQDVTKATNDLQAALADPGHTAAQAAYLSDVLAGKQGALADFQAQVTAATNGTSTAIEINNQRLQGLSNTTSAANTQINLLTSALAALTGANVTADQAEIAVTQAVAAATQAVQNHSAVLSFNNGVLDLSNEKSAAASQLLIALAGTMQREIGVMEQQGVATDVVNAKTDALRNEFIRQAEQLGATAAEAQALADRYFGIPGQVHTEVTADASQANGALDEVQAKINSIMQNRIAQLTLNPNSSNGTNGQLGVYAEGGVVPGYAPGVDSVHAMLSPGEGVLVPEAVRGLGGAAAIEAINSRFSSRIPGFSGGGVVSATDHIVVSVNNAAMLSALSQLANTQAAEAAAIGGAGGAAQWANVALQALAMEGQSASWLPLLLQRMNQESGGNQYAINLWDSNAAAGDPSRGLMQTIGSTFNAYHDPRTSWDIYDPLANTAAATRYTLAAYGSLSAWGQPGGYELGTNYVPHDGLAYLHRGEAVVPADQNQQGSPWQDANVTVVAQFGDETIEATAVRVVHGTLGDLRTNWSRR